MPSIQSLGVLYLQILNALPETAHLCLETICLFIQLPDSSVENLYGVDEFDVLIFSHAPYLAEGDPHVTRTHHPAHESDGRGTGRPAAGDPKNPATRATRPRTFFLTTACCLF